MYKYYKKNSDKVMEYDFSSIIEFLDYIEEAKVKRDVFGNNLASESDDVGFTKTKNLDEAKMLLKYGCHKDFDKIVKLKLNLEKYIKLKEERCKQYNYYVGYAPDVKAYLEGNPLSMLNKNHSQNKHIDIYYNAAILGRVTEGEIFNRGVITLAIVEMLERKGFSVGLNVFTMSRSYDQIHYANFNLKKPGERLNIQKLFFPLCHPSFLRRLVFRLREVTPDIEEHWEDGYGATCGDEEIREILNLKDNDIVICQPDEMGINGRDIINDANNMFEYMNRSIKDDILLETKEKKKVR